jgi:FdhD protein
VSHESVRVELERVVSPGQVQHAEDDVVAEAPLEIRVEGTGGARTIAVTMRTPGADAELAAGFLYCEGIVDASDQIAAIEQVASDATVPGSTTAGDAGPKGSQTITVRLAGAPPVLPAALERHFLATSSCGVCGKAGLDQLHRLPVPNVGSGSGVDFTITPDVLMGLPAALRAAQDVFGATGGLHAAAAFDAHGRVLAAREDIGRHNAIDKLVGWAMLAGRLPLSAALVVVSGRASFEVVQKCLRAGVPLVAAVSAPSSLAIETAAAGGQTLVGFLSESRFNVYSHPDRIRR